MIHYGMTKTALLAISRGLAETVGGSGVTVNSVLPGPTRSEGVGTFVEDLARQQGITMTQAEEQFFKKTRPTSLIQRFITPEEVAHLVNYLVLPDASAITGSAFRIDGGLVRSIF
jgi:NAD(P)-dependent dehydrogenase (short-subunit alcohol dehydrogenase family)